MKQEPILSKKDISTDKNLPKTIRVSVLSEQSYHIFYVFLSLLGHVMCLAIVVLCFQIPEQIIPLHSEIEVQFQESLDDVPEEVTPLSDMAQETSDIVRPEPSSFSENLPDIDKISPISIAKPIHKQKILTKITPGNHSPEKTHQTLNNIPATNQNLATTESNHTPYTAFLAKAQKISLEQRCSEPVKDYPLAAHRRHEQGKVMVHLQLLPNGKISQVSVNESSGFSDLDQAAKKAVLGMKCKAALDQDILNAIVQVNFTLH